MAGSKKPLLLKHISPFKNKGCSHFFSPRSTSRKKRKGKLRSHKNVLIVLGFHKHQPSCCWNNLSFFALFCPARVPTLKSCFQQAQSPLSNAALSRGSPAIPQTMTFVSYFRGFWQSPQHQPQEQPSKVCAQLNSRRVKEISRSPSASPTFLSAARSVGLFSTQTPRGWRDPPASSKWIIGVHLHAFASLQKTGWFWGGGRGECVPDVSHGSFCVFKNSELSFGLGGSS